MQDQNKEDWIKETQELIEDSEKQKSRKAKELENLRKEILELDQLIDSSNTLLRDYMNKNSIIVEPPCTLR